MNPLLRLVTCGGIDSGKSTLVGQLLDERKPSLKDESTGLERSSARDGAEDAQVDVAYRFFGTPRRRFIVADAPGHEHYTRSMVSAASTAELALMVIDATQGVVVQTRRHSRILSLLGVRNVVLAINKMDAVAWDQATFDRICAECSAFAAELGFVSVAPFPLSALTGANVTRASHDAPWFRGASLLEYLENIEVESGSRADAAFRMPVQWVNRAHPELRGYCGRVAQGEVRPGQKVRLVPSGRESSVRSIIYDFAEQHSAVEGDSITLTLEDEIDIGRGEVLCDASDPAACSDQFQARLVWMSDHALVAGRPYIGQFNANGVTATVTEIRYVVDVNSGAHLAAKTLSVNELGIVNISVDRPVPFAPYVQNRRLGSFVLIDRITHETAGAGMIEFALRRADNIHWQRLSLDRYARAAIKHQKAQCIWMTGLPGSGKSTIANLLEKWLHADGRHTILLDGDNVRHGLNRDLGFTEADRVENLRRVAEVSRLMVDAGLIVIVAFIAPFSSERAFARSLFAEGEFTEVFIDTPLQVCEERDPKGLYHKARTGSLVNFTGIDSPYEVPEAPEIRLSTVGRTPESCAEEVAKMLGVHLH